MSEYENAINSINEALDKRLDAIKGTNEYVRGEAKCSRCRLALQVDKWVTISSEEYEWNSTASLFAKRTKDSAMRLKD